MIPKRGPHYSQKCPFHIIKDQPLSAKKSVAQCVDCVSCGNQRLQHMKPDLHQLAYLTILENSPKYNPKHQSGASFTTFIKSHVCGKLWAEKKKQLKSIPVPSLDSDYIESQHQRIDDVVAWQVDLNRFKAALPQLIKCLPEKQASVLKLKFFEGFKAVEIAKRLGISEGRVSQLSRLALTKMKRLYLFSAVRW